MLAGMKSLYWSESFLPHDAMLVQCMLSSYVRLSQAITTKMAKRMMMQATSYDSPVTLVFCCKKISAKFQLE